MFNKTILVFVFIFISFNAYSQERGDTKYWIIFKDKGGFIPGMEIMKGSAAYEKGRELLNDRAIKRRLKVLSEDKLIDFSDLPVNNDYVRSVSGLGIDLIAKSRWLNGVSAYMNKAQLDKVKALDFVSQIKVVKKLYKQEEIILPGRLTPDSLKDINEYGNSYRQMEQVNVPKVHDLKITGKGVLIASFDDGFDWKDHEALKNIKVIDEYDFINKDKNTFPEKNQKYKDESNQGAHGTATLSTMSGYYPGKLISPAFDSELLLAKTEYVT
ncbi:MAG: hypothetical protein ABI792_06715, partial [bacterium]